MEQKTWKSGDTITADDLNALEQTAHEAAAAAEGAKAQIVNLRKALGIKGTVSAKGLTEAQVRGIRETLGI